MAWKSVRPALAIQSVCVQCAVRLALAFALPISVISSPLFAAEFRAITPEMIAAISPYQLHTPIITVSAISGDGSTIAGYYRETGVDYDCARGNCGIGPFVWSLDNDMFRSHITSSTPFDAAPVFATALSHDGQAALIVSEFGYYEGAIYRDGQPRLLRPRVVSEEPMWAADMSSDSGVVVGNLGSKPFRWDAAGELREFNALPTTNTFTATAISGDGRVAVLNAQPGFAHGWSWPGDRSTRGNAYTWTAAAGLSELPKASGDNYSQAAAASHDGSTVVGTSVLLRPYSTVGRAVRWDDGRLTQLDSLAEHPWSSALDVSADGEFIVGRVFREPIGIPNSTVDPPTYEFVNFINQGTEQPSRAVLWNAQGNVFDLQNLLVVHFGLGTQLAGWKLTNAAHISDDGRVIAGTGVGPDGKGAIWVAMLGVPEPNSLALIVGVVAILPLVAARRQLQAPA